VSIDGDITKEYEFTIWTPDINYEQEEFADNIDGWFIYFISILVSLIMASFMKFIFNKDGTLIFAITTIILGTLIGAGGITVVGIITLFVYIPQLIKMFRGN